MRRKTRFTCSAKRIPTQKYLHGLVSQVPEDFLFTFKVMDDITSKKVCNLPRFRAKAGKPNWDYLNADLFATAFLKPCEEFKQNVGVSIFEFSRFYPTDYEHGRDFVADLDAFPGKLPTEWRYGVEMRNKKFLHPDYFACLRKQGVAHCFNSWTGMPQLAEQITMDGADTSDDFSVTRMLLKPERTYEEAVKEFSPYKETKELFPEARQVAAALIKRMKEKKKGFIYVNNRLEEDALKTIHAVAE